MSIKRQFNDFFLGVQNVIERICHRLPMQIEKSQPEGKNIMPATRFTEFPVISVDPRVGIARSVPGTDD